MTGRSVTVAELETPALLLDLDIMTANLASTAARLRGRGIALRPHAKTHKSAEIARRQLDHGAVGLTVATIGEAEVFARHGFTDLFIAYPVFATGTKAARLAELARRVNLRIGVESAAGAQALARALASVTGPGARRGAHRDRLRPAQDRGAARRGGRSRGRVPVPWPRRRGGVHPRRPWLRQPRLRPRRRGGRGCCPVVRGAAAHRRRVQRPRGQRRIDAHRRVRRQPHHRGTARYLRLQRPPAGRARQLPGRRGGRHGRRDGGEHHGQRPGRDRRGQQGAGE